MIKFFLVATSLLGITYTHAALAWSHQAIYGWYVDCALAATLRARTIVSASDFTDWGGGIERMVYQNHYYLNGTPKTVQDQLHVDEPPVTGDWTFYLAFLVAGVQVSSLPPHLDGLWEIDAFARGDRWYCWPGETPPSPWCWLDIAGPGEGGFDDAQGYIDP
jgi:hypothetical protein